ncbi:MAG: hypothetical protein ACJ74W_12140 [Pyrinomonadaceae bacterium]
MPDEPIVVTGGSVTIDFKDTLQHQLNAPQGMYSYSGAGTLVRVLVNDKEVAALAKEDVVTIVYNTD